jgi:hypothetical protein
MCDLKAVRLILHYPDARPMKLERFIETYIRPKIFLPGLRAA